MITSLDGYVEDESGKFDWAEPDEEVHTFVNDLMRSVGTHLYGRRMYETMVAWETLGTRGEPSHIRDFGEIWRGSEKVVYSRSLEAVSGTRTRLERDLDPAAIRDLKESAERDLTVSGPALAAHGFREGLVDECHLFVAPIIVGGGKPVLPDGVRLQLELADEHRFGNGTVYLRYRAGTS